ANTFVAGFIGSPPMNLFKGQVEGGTFRAPGCEVAGIAMADGNVTLGVRPEDCVVGGEANLTARVYGMEPTGDMTFLTLTVDGTHFEVKADRDYRADLESEVTVAFDQSRIYFFDAETGARIR
ncbi:MAG: TOBE domain-containing protein, partial [Paracoccaceae bacterium]